MKKLYSFAKTLSVLALFGAQGMMAQTYCTQAAASTADDEIFNVTFGSLNNTTNCSSIGGTGSLQNRYNNYTTLVAAPSLLMGSNYPLSITGGQCNTGSYCGTAMVWIDFNQNGLFTDPGEAIWTSPYTCWAVSGTTMIATGGITIPTTVTPGTTRMRVTLVEGGATSPCNAYTWGETEDYNVNIISPVPCSGAPGANSVVTPTYAICPNGSAQLSLASNYTVSGITYQWGSSTISNVGPFTPITNATLTSYNTPTLNTNTYYSVVITCVNGSSIQASAGQVSIQPTVISGIPYFEGFEGINNTNQLPNCSWNMTSPGNQSRTYTGPQTQQRVARTGSKFGSFYYFPSGTNYFYTNGIQMEPGVTYSATVWYATDYYGYLTYSDLSIMLGTSQSTTGLVTIASTNGPAASSAYKAVTNTFTVASSGIYYVAIRGTSGGNCCAYHLNWDDLAITAPCSINSPTLGLNTSTTTVCAGDQVILTASGANTYSWTHGPTTAVVMENPTQSGMYSVAGTNTASGCSVSLQQYINVNPVPVMAVFADKQVVCAGQQAIISAQGAQTYTWSTQSNNQFITVNPTSATTYSVIGGNQYGCTSMITQMIGVNPLPTVTAQTDRDPICRGESANLTGGGAVTYNWAANTLFVAGQTAVISPNTTTTYTLTGTNANGCSNVMTVVQNVAECVGVQEMTTTLAGVKVYPNPTGGVFTVELGNGAEKTIQVTDVTGRVVLNKSSKNEKIDMNINSLSNGIYYVRIQSENAVEVIKVIKN